MVIDSTSFWIICVSVSAPIAAVVGFAIQIRRVKQLRLENEKLVLEIEGLRKTKEESERRIVIPTTEEVMEYNDRDNDVMFSRKKFPGPCPGSEEGEPIHPALNVLLTFLVCFTLIVFILYLIFDVYSLVVWLWSFL